MEQVGRKVIRIRIPFSDLTNIATNNKKETSERNNCTRNMILSEMTDQLDDEHNVKHNILSNEKFDIFYVEEYVDDIFEYYMSREVMYKICPYFDRQSIKEKHRWILINWLVEVQMRLAITHETLYLTVAYIDTFLSKSKIEIEELQLVACSCLLIASKYEELWVPLIEDIEYLTRYSINANDIRRMERRILSTLDFNLSIPISYTFLRRYSNIIDGDIFTLTLSRFYLECSLQWACFVSIRPSLIATAVYLLAEKVQKYHNKWSSILEQITGYDKEEVEELMQQINQNLIDSRNCKEESIFNKYNDEVFYYVSTYPFLNEQKSS